MSEVTRRNALKLAAGGTALTGVTILAAETAHAQAAVTDGQIVEPSKEERAAWDEFLKEKTQKGITIKEIPIPYQFTIKGVTFTGVFHLRDPVENSSTDGVVIGPVLGTYNLDKNDVNARFYDPSGSFLRAEIELSFAERRLKARVCQRRWDGRWKCSEWLTLASW